MKVHIIDAPAVEGSLLYRVDEYSIDFKEVSRTVTELGIASLLLNMLQIDVNVDNGHLMAPWGLLPHTRWIASALPPLMSVTRCGLAVSEEPLTTGIAIGLGGSESWGTYFDGSSTTLEMRQDDEAVEQWVEFADGCVMGLRAGLPVRLRLMPKIVGM
ncbi:hypothetical protein DOE76_08075 [Leifsonia sp. ku-ls]|nr:hypothetical protein DOE76_08075 [Leifsonia sp. ku-ls]